MVHLSFRERKPAGVPPGTLVHTGERHAETITIRLMDYSTESCDERLFKTIEEAFPYLDRETVTWLDIVGLHQVDIIEKLGNHLNIHPLVQEDILHTEQRPKVEDYEEYIFIVLRALTPIELTNGQLVASEQLSLILGPNFVITFQESEGDPFGTVRERLRTGKGRVRRMGADYLCYALLDAVVDYYFSALESIGDYIEELEDTVLIAKSEEALEDIHELKREMLFLRRALWPLREMMSNLQRLESELITLTTRTFLRDVYDHTVQVLETVETLRDLSAGLLEIYLSSLSNRMNEVMKVLTIIATIFIPLTFIAGIYGMNFQYMPELTWRGGYFLALGIMLIVGVALLLFFRRKHWI
jgi:magnesium transporter